MLDEIGADRLMFETDFPHPTSLYPGVQEKLVKTLGGYPFETRRQVLERKRGRPVQPGVLMSGPLSGVRILEVALACVRADRGRRADRVGC